MSLLLKRAFDQAAVWHRAQFRKYPGVEVPYMSHLAGVAATLSRHHLPEPVIAAGALHDTIEDCGVTHADLVRLFGEEVAKLVNHVTEQNKGATWEERKRLYLEHFVQNPWEAQAITLADKIDNFDSIVVCAELHGDPWAMFKRGKHAQMLRFDELEQKLEVLAPHPLIDEFRKALDRVRAVPDLLDG